MLTEKRFHKLNDFFRPAFKKKNTNKKTSF